ncbi:hypothetical protein BV20DRAFT_364977 [Pilatotrama ljubarskyi]|nr:hypothetical protein BV20DRAFT_364977 [Pilatotrama ljubarskyi]
MVQLPPEVFSAIVSYATPRDLLALSCTSKAFQRAAEPKLYEVMILRDAHSTFLACHAVMVRDAYRGAYVKRLVIYQDPRRVTTRNDLRNVPPQFWLALQHALTKLPNLEFLAIHDPACEHSWLLDHDDIKFQLREATLRLPWDGHMVAFLQTQHKLQLLTTSDSREELPLFPLPPNCLPVLEVYSGPLLAVAELLGSPLKRVQMAAEDETVPFIPTVIADLGKIMKTLRNLCIVGLPEELVLETVQLVSKSVYASNLRYLGILPLPAKLREWNLIHRCLMKLPALTAIELDVSHWEPRPNEHFQRAILLELRIFCPTLLHVVFWITQHRFHWNWRNGQWLFLYQAGRFQMHENLWRT